MSFLELDIITDYYGSKLTERSQVPLINHIHEGLCVLQAIRASGMSKKAFCIHPIVQNDVTTVDLSKVNLFVYRLAEEYKHKANSYLCTSHTDHVEKIDQLKFILGTTSTHCFHMLYADKIQNQKDFYLYHYKKHKRSEQLNNYFNLWLKFLRQELRY
jgi:hypothetical protein